MTARAILVLCALLWHSPLHAQAGSGDVDTKICALIAANALELATRRDKLEPLESAVAAETQAKGAKMSEKARATLQSIISNVVKLVYTFGVTSPNDSMAIMFFACRKGAFSREDQGLWFQTNLDSILATTAKCASSTPDGPERYKCIENSFR